MNQSFVCFCWQDETFATLFEGLKQNKQKLQTGK